MFRLKAQRWNEDFGDRGSYRNIRFTSGSHIRKRPDAKLPLGWAEEKNGGRF
ncbi:hypothetical protein HW556_00320 [Hymenobacter sp. P5252]|uniref:Uncharacterized protein n=1 Tax=Hymenobacter terrestris TaxID=2748310 RepID=A0ABX2PXD0_9BACT|nr:hypothetical protein [Hymenobacter terrestris]